MVGLDDLDDQPHDARGRVVLAALLHLLQGERAHEIFIDPPEGVAVDVERGQRLDEFAQDVVADRAVVLGQRVGEVRIVALDVVHGAVQRPAEVRAFRQFEKMRETSLGRQVDDAARLEGVRRRRAEAASRSRLKRLLRLREPPVCIAQEEKPEHGPGIFRGLQPRVRAQLIGDGPKPPLDVPVFRCHPALRIQLSTVDSGKDAKSSGELRRGEGEAARAINSPVSEQKSPCSREQKPLFGRKISLIRIRRKCFT